MIRGRTFVTVLDPERDQACVDLRLPVGDEVRAIFIVLGNDIYALDR